jgi:cation transport ATPase
MSAHVVGSMVCRRSRLRLAAAPERDSEHSVAHALVGRLEEAAAAAGGPRAGVVVSCRGRPVQVRYLNCHGEHK